MIALVTGSGGFIGRHLVRRLLAAGFEVRCLRHVRRTRRGGPVPSPADAPPPGLSFRTADFHSPETLAACGCLSEADLVFHLAGVTKAACRDAYYAGNTLTTVNLAEALRLSGARPRRFLLLSSIAAAGPAGGRPLGEEDPPRPVEQYGESKLAAERALAERPWLPSTVLRASAVYGPGDRDFLRLFRQLDRGLNCFYGNRGHRISLLHVADLVEGLLAAALSERAAGRTYFLGGDTVCWAELQEHVAAVLGRRVRLTLDIPPPLADLLCALVGAAGSLCGRGFLLNPQKRAISRQPAWVCSSERARRDFGFRPARRLEEGLAETAAWYREQGWLAAPRRRDTAPGPDAC